MQWIGRFEIIRRLGGGGFGEVYLARDPAIGRQVAIKIFRPRDENILAFITSTDEEALQVLRERFLSEARILASLEDEPHVVNVHEYGEAEDGAPYYVMPFLPHSLADELGQDLLDTGVPDSAPMAERSRALPLKRALKVIEQMLAGLAAAHNRGLIHRDIKPSNLMLSQSGELRIVDFGIAKVPDSHHSTVSNLGIGSRNYIAPEQRESAKHVDARADIYAAGVVAYRTLTGRLPVGRFRDPVEWVPALGQPMNQLILDMMAIHREQRPADGTTALARFRQALLEVGAEEQATTRVWQPQAATEVNRGAASGAGDQRKPLSWMAAAAILLALVAIPAWWFLAGPERSDDEARVADAQIESNEGVADAADPATVSAAPAEAAVDPDPGPEPPEDSGAEMALDATPQLPDDSVPVSPGEAMAETGLARPEPVEVEGELQPEPEPASEPEPAATPDPARERVRAIQAELRRLGRAIEVDGLMGPGTASHIRAFEQARGGPERGEPSEALLAALRGSEHWPELEIAEAEAAPTAPRWQTGQVFQDCPACPEMIVLPAGRFTMGSPSDERQRRAHEGPQREVAIESFALGIHHVTFAQFDACVDAGGCRERPYDRNWGRGPRPVINVSWHDAMDFVEWLSEHTGVDYRLPSEAEWEYAARAGTRTRFHTGDCINRDQANYNGLRQARGCLRGSLSNRPSVGGSYPANAWGLHDMHGNLADWVADCWNDSYQGAPQDGRAWLDGQCDTGIHRGGSWYQGGELLRSASRVAVARDYQNFYLGFRVARSLND